MVFSNNLLMGAAASAGAAPAAGYVPKGAVWLDGSADYFTRTQVAGNRKTYTLSIWVKHSKLGSAQMFVSAGATAVDWFKFDSTDALDIGGIEGGARALMSTALYRDPTAWMHVVLAVNTADSVAGDRVRAYVNGRLLTDFSTRNNPAQDSESNTSNTVIQNIGNDSYDSSASPFGSYMSELIMLDGYARPPSDFGTEDVNGLWIPKDPTDSVAAYKGSNGFWLDFADDTDLGNDISGNTNHFTATSMDAANWTYDRPADSGTTIGNLATYNPIDILGNTLATANVWSLGNTKVAHQGGVDASNSILSIATTSGKWYMEWVSGTANSNFPIFGIMLDNVATYVDGIKLRSGDGNIRQYPGGPYVSYGTSYSTGSIISMAFDQDNGAVYYGKDGTWFNSATDAEIAAGTTTNAGSTSSNWAALGDGTSLKIGNQIYNSMDLVVRVSEDSWSYTPPDGFVSLCTANLPAPTITKPSDNFLPILYEGNGIGQRVGNFIPFTDSKTVDNSCRFDSGSSDYLTKTFTATSSGQTKCTVSFWHKRGNDVNELIFNAFDGSGGETWLQIGSTSQSYGFRIVNDANIDISTARIIEDTDSWHNYVVEIDTTSAVGVAADKVKIYIDGVRVTEFDSFNSGPTYPALDDEVYFGADDQHHICASQLPGNFVDGYIAEFVFVNGAAHPASVFGETDTSTNRWIPKDITSTLASASDFGTNGFYLEFGTDSALGTDTSGNTNTFTPTNIDAGNQMYDTPTRNMPVLSPVAWLASGWDSQYVTMSEGNLTAALTNSTSGSVSRTWNRWAVNSGKWYVENTVITYGTWSAGGLGIVGATSFGASKDSSTSWISTSTISVNYYVDNNSTAADSMNRNINGANTVLENPSLSAGDTLAIAFDLDSSPQTIKFYFNNVLKDTTNLPSGYVWMFSTAETGNGTSTYNFGSWTRLNSVDMTLDATAGGYFRYTPPTDYLAITQDAMPENTAGITGLSWIKNRDATDFHIWFDRARGVYDYLRLSNAAGNTTDGYAAQVTNANSVQRFLQQGVQVGKMDQVNTSAESYVLWNWANDGAATDIAINEYDTGVPTLASTFRANTDAGFSIVTYSGDGDATTKVGHGLGVKPDLIIVKSIALASGTAGWYTYHSSIGATATLWLDLASAVYTDANYWANIEPTDEVWSMQDNGGMNQSSSTFVAYCWAGVDGYSKFGTYEGNSDNDGPFIYLGFKPSILIWKNIDDGTASWRILDNKRNPYNPVAARLYPNQDWTESDNSSIDFTANGFKVITNSADVNTNTIVYAAWAENPFGGSGVGQARAR